MTRPGGHAKVLHAQINLAQNCPAHNVKMPTIIANANENNNNISYVMQMCEGLDKV